MNRRGVQSVVCSSARRRLNEDPWRGHRQAQKGKQSYAVKVINKHKFVTLGGRVQQMFSEVEVMDKLSHPNVININDVFNTPSYLVLVLELCVV